MISLQAGMSLLGKPECFNNVEMTDDIEATRIFKQDALVV
jgi:hypothetical protein